MCRYSAMLRALNLMLVRDSAAAISLFLIPPLLKRLPCFLRNSRGGMVRLPLSAAIPDGGYCGYQLIAVFFYGIQFFEVVHLCESLSGFGIEDGRRRSSMCYVIQQCLGIIKVELRPEQSVAASFLETGHDDYVYEDFTVA
ncbi:hypothetical protein Aduo_008511 [Ancylostoma duodenale]